MGQVQSQGQILWYAAVDIRGSALPSAAKNYKNHYQSKVFVIRGAYEDNSKGAVDQFLILPCKNTKTYYLGIHLLVCRTLHHRDILHTAMES